jgi:hypothetical protein
MKDKDGIARAIYVTAKGQRAVKERGKHAAQRAPGPSTLIPLCDGSGAPARRT